MLRSIRLATLAALLGTMIWLIGVSATVISYNHDHATAYSYNNHFVSELGLRDTSKLTWLFNASEALGSLMALPIIYALARRLGTRLAYLAAGIGYGTFLTVSTIGTLGLIYDIREPDYVSLLYLKAHILCAVLFFTGWLITVTLFTITFYRQPSMAMALGGTVCSIMCVVLLYSCIQAVYQTKQKIKANPDPLVRAIFESRATPRMVSEFLDKYRADLSGAAVAEWGVTMSVFLWHALAVIFLRMMGKRELVEVNGSAAALREKVTS